MQGYVERRLEQDVKLALEESPVAALLGPRQCGKSTLAREGVLAGRSAVRLDLELPSDRRKLGDPEAFFALHEDELVCLDEVQRMPELFPVLRGVVDRRGRNGRFLILGSASPDLLRQSSESLAGRIRFLELGPFLLPEVAATGGTLERLWLRGGFPRSFLAGSDRESSAWRSDFVRTFLERDLAFHAARVPTERLGRLWRMCAHEHGQLLNASKLASALGVSSHTIRSYLELLEKTFMVRLLPPCEANVKKRLVKSPRVYVRDSGIVHALLEIRDHDDLLGHPVRGASWEGLVVEHAIRALPTWRASFYRTHAGAEIDLVMERGRRRIGVECKASSAPRVSRGLWSAAADLGLEQTFVVAPVDEAYPLGDAAAVVPLGELMRWAPRLDAGERHPAMGGKG